MWIEINEYEKGKIVMNLDQVSNFTYHGTLTKIACGPTRWTLNGEHWYEAIREAFNCMETDLGDAGYVRIIARNND